MPIRIYNSYPTDIPIASVANAITFAKNNGADIISNSWGYFSSNPNLYPVIVSAISDATNNGRNGKGCVVLFAAGNNANILSGNIGYIAFPANVNVPGVLTVGASDRNDRQANYCPISNLNFSDQIIDIMAPSHKAYSCQISTEIGDVWTIDIPGSNGYNPVELEDCEGAGTLPIVGSYLPSSGTNYTAYTGHFGGTSAACPQVAGVAALILSVNPNLTQIQVDSIIKTTARKAGPYNYQTILGLPHGTWHFQMGYGVVNAYAAVKTVCATTNFTNQTVNTNQTVTGCDIYSKNVTVTGGAKLILDALDETTIDGDFEVQLGSELEVK